jgi:NADPH-dependent glutamate synthase beta subunit-like oxidoreductase/ferredoxin
MKIILNNKEVNVPEGLSVMGAARLTGIDIPSLCYRKGKPHFTSCMICMVKDAKTGKLIPSCSVNTEEGMEIITRDEEIEESRRMALELLLSEHVGDCEAPCQVTCPAHMDIPLMNRLLAEGKFSEALMLVKKDIPLPSVFGRICPAPCEGACHRKSVDTAVSICLLKRYAGDHDFTGEGPWIPAKASPTGKKVAIIGAGPAGLAAAYYLQLFGHQCDVYDRHEKPGGSLWKEVESGILPLEVLRNEIGVIEKLGAWFYPHTEVDEEQIKTLQRNFDAVLIACGSGESGVENFGLEMSDKGLNADKQNYLCSKANVFAAGSVLRHTKLAIRTLGQGKEVAFSINQYLSGLQVKGVPSIFNSRFGKLLPEEVLEFLKESVERDRIEPEVLSRGFTKEQVMAEAERCLHCDCRALKDCKLRDLSDEYKANQKHYWSEDRKLIRKQHFGKISENSVGSIKVSAKQVQDVFVIYEANKCIKCGICVRITEEHKDTYGMSFIGRGFDVVVGVPFNESLSAGLSEVAQQVIDECPTGAITAMD